jgi:hypothetical protein
VERIFPAKNGRREGSPTKIYYQRAWTFQEYLLAKRRVTFERDSIFWECCSTTWFEDVDCSDGALLSLGQGLSTHRWVLENPRPQLSNYVDLVGEFNQLHLTFENYCLGAFAEMTSALSRGFEDGFLCGLPEMVFDVALLWQPNGEIKRRQTGPCDSRRSSVSSPCIPSWSWLGGLVQSIPGAGIVVVILSSRVI